MADTEKTPAMLLDELSALDPARRRELAETVCEGYDAMRKLLETLGPLAYPSGVTSP
jgi:hypothetical protein